MTHKSKHTSGNWIFEKYALSPQEIAQMKSLGISPQCLCTNDGSVPIYSKMEDGSHVAICKVVSVIDRNKKTPYDHPDDERDANATLIASAPRLQSENIILKKQISELKDTLSKAILRQGFSNDELNVARKLVKQVTE